MMFSTPLTREARCCASTIVANEKKGGCGLGGRDIALQNRVREKSIKIVRGLPFEFEDTCSMSSECMLEVKNLSASNTFATGIRKTSILTREVLQKPKL